ncbi:MAG: alpha/beta fold hydrolase [Gemmatimonadales bacterium]
MTAHHEEVNGVDLFVRHVGNGPDVVVLHGGPGAHHDYLLPHFDMLATGRRLRYYDQRGGGRSPVSRETATGWREHVADLDALITTWNIAPATIVGYSWGGLLALLYLTEHADRVGRLALVSSAPAHAPARRELDRRLAELMRAPEIVEARTQLRASGLRERDPDAYRQRAFELSVAGYFTHPQQARALTPFRVTERTQRAVWESLGEYDLREKLAAVSVPAFVMHGRHDAISLSSAQETARLLGAECLVMEHSAHVPYVEETQHFVAALNQFLPRAT